MGEIVYIVYIVYIVSTSSILTAPKLDQKINYQLDWRLDK
jgi:hypothetical protein